MRPSEPLHSNSGLSRQWCLDSLRGLAALVVVVHHMAMALPLAAVWLWSPLVSGHEAVIFFFVLSGFVLATAWKPGAGYAPYVIKRVFRIYLPYLVSIGVAAGLCLWLARGPLPQMSPWFNLVWPPLDGAVLWHHVVFLRSFQNQTLSPVIWSLVHELRVSLLFPLLFAAVARWPWWAALGMGLAGSVASTPLSLAAEHALGYRVDYGDTLHYVLLFIVGALLVRYQGHLTGWWRSRTPVRRGWLLALGGSLLLGGRFVQLAPPGPWQRLVAPLVLADWLVGLGVAIVIVAALASPEAQRRLSWRPLVWLGTVSYSLYLYHALVLLALVHAGVGAWLWVVLPLSLLVAAAGYYGIERPAMAAGRSLAARWRGRQAAHTASASSANMAATSPTRQPGGS